MATPTLSPKTAPQPSGWPLLGNLPQLADSSRLQWFKTLHDQYGDVVKINAAGRNLYLLNHPDYAKYVLQTNNRNYRKGLGYNKLKPVLGKGLLTSEGDYWRRQRRLAQPAFHRQKIANFGRIMVENTAAMCTQWQTHATSGQPFDVAAEMMRLTLNVVSQALFTTALTAAELQTVGRVFPPLLHETNRRTTNPFNFLEKLPTATNRAYEEHTAAMNQIIYRIINDRRQNPAAADDLLGMFMAAADEETGETMTDEQLRDEIMTIFIAGHETTATALAWGWMILSQQPAIRAQLQAEIDQVLQGRLPTADDFASLPYTLMFFKEVLRLYPPVPLIGRTPLERDEIGGYDIEPMTTVIISPYLLHRHPDFWDNPEGFDPYRFTAEAEKTQHKFVYLPFGGGPRLCIGNNFALLEAVLILATIVPRYELNLLPAAHVEPDISLTIRPKNGLLVQAVER